MVKEMKRTLRRTKGMVPRMTLRRLLSGSYTRSSSRVCTFLTRLR